MVRPARTVDPSHRAHLTGVSAPSPPIHRYDATPALRTLARRHWVPVWCYRDGRTHVQKVLQYPVCLTVVTPDYARFYGVAAGLSTVALAGDGWAVGTMLQPAAGRLLWGAPVSELTDRHVPVEAVPGLAGTALAEEVRAVMTPAPGDPASHGRAVAVVEERLARHLPVDDTGLFVNALVELIESTPELTRVDQLSAATGTSPRALQRITRDRLGLTPKWLIQRRRLHEAAQRLKEGRTTLAAIAHELGYSDQAHFTRHWSAVTGMAPGRYQADQ